MKVFDVLAEYERRFGAMQHGMMQARAGHLSAATVLAIAVALFLMLGTYAIRKQVSFWWPTLPVPVAAASARLFARRRKDEYRCSRVKRFYERALQRVRGTWIGNGIFGDEFEDPSHSYARDLNVFGEGSLFELLCIARTGVGKRGLADYLLTPPSLEETEARQEAILELRDRTDLREKLALLGPHEFSESHWETFSDWLERPSTAFPLWFRLAIFLSSLLAVALMLAAFVGVLPFAVGARYLTPLLLLHSVLGLILRSRINAMIDSVRALSAEVPIIREGLEILETEQFNSQKLKKLSAQIRKAPRAMRTLERLLNALHERSKEWFYLPSLALMLGTQICMAIEAWRMRHGAALPKWLAVWAEFEALNSLACYAFENPNNAFPELLRGGSHFEACALGHPLLPRETCVRNDVELNEKLRFYVISGSNMSGKSTLLRAIGLNAVLACAGAPVRAGRLRISALSVCASLSVVDSLLNGKSKFLSEVERLRVMIAAAETGPVLFLIDEILSGTNSRDRRIAAEAIIRALVDRGALGAASTHDLALCEIATDASHGANVHLGSAEGGNPLDLDYLLKPGVTTERNALAIARMAGVDVG